MKTQSGVSKSNCKNPKSLLKTSVVKLLLSETSETTGMLENSVKEEKEDILWIARSKDQEEEQVSVYKRPCKND